MLLVKITNGEVEQFPYTLGNLRRDNPQTSFPKQIPSAIFEGYGVYSVTESDRPSYDNLVQRLVRGTPVYSDSWNVGYTAENLPQDQAEANVRNSRDSLLADTDWMALSDVTMSTEMGAYRQALRDVTGQSGFPYNITWPTKPNA
jgi:hypothetical protein